jgi:hypothetical protein
MKIYVDISKAEIFLTDRYRPQYNSSPKTNFVFFLTELFQNPENGFEEP